ncbi:MAG: fumarate hydratase [Rhodospirillaceae bacterium]
MASSLIENEIFPLESDETDYRKLDAGNIGLDTCRGEEILVVDEEALRALSMEAFHDINHYLRPAHLKQLASILEDKEASANDHFVAWDLLKNANIAAGGILPMCQDTGTCIIMGKKGHRVWTSGNDESALATGASDAYTTYNLRYSQLAPISMYEERNTGNNLPAQVDIYSSQGQIYKLTFVAKGGGSANKSFLFQQTPSILHPERLVQFLKDQFMLLGTAACPPYHLAIVIGGTSAEMNLKTVKLASIRALDTLPSTGGSSGHAFRDLEMEKEILSLSRTIGIGAQFGGKYFCHDVRVIRLPRHGASFPIGIGVSCSADRQANAKITREGVFLEALETNPAQYIPDVDESSLGNEVVSVDLNQPMEKIRELLSNYPVKTRLSLTGPIVVARDLAHLKIAERLDKGEPMPEYLRHHPVYYAGPAKTPTGFASGSFGPTTAGRMDSYVDRFQENGGSFIMLAKGNRSQQVTDACKKHGGFYLGSIGGPAARLAQDCIRKVECLEYKELGMEAVWRIEVENFPAFIVVDDKGNDFFANIGR